jgi:hypothetical protein
VEEAFPPFQAVVGVMAVAEGSHPCEHREDPQVDVAFLNSSASCRACLSFHPLGRESLAAQAWAVVALLEVRRGPSADMLALEICLFYVEKGGIHKSRAIRDRKSRK